MAEAIIANLALTLRVLVVGGFLLILPRISRKGLLFGAYIGEATADQEGARRLQGRWDAGCLILMVLSLLVGYGISLAGRPLAGNFTGTAVLLIGALVLYLRIHSRARALVPPGAARQAAQATAPLLGSEPKGEGLARFALGICILGSLATFIYAMVSYQAMAGRSFAAVMIIPSVSLLLSPFLALLALLTATAKRSFRGGSGGGSFESQDAFRATMARMLSWTALLICAFMTFLSVMISRMGLSGFRSLWVGIGLAGGILIVFLLGNLIRIVKRYGQGGALLEQGAVDAPLTNGIADNAHWVWGLFYVDREDPSIMVEKRFGIGYSFNYGNRMAILIVAAFLVLSLGLAAFLLIGTLI
jgi:hypothetical protein